MAFMNPDESFDWNADYDALFDRLYNYFRYRFGDEPTAEDLAQDTFVRLWRYRDGYDSKWLVPIAFRIARSVGIDFYRRMKWRGNHQSFDDKDEDTQEFRSEEDLEEIVERKEQTAHLNKILKILSDVEREVIAWKYGAELNNREIAKVINTWASRVDTIHSRAVYRAERNNRKIAKEIKKMTESNVGTIHSRTIKRLRNEWEKKV